MSHDKTFERFLLDAKPSLLVLEACKSPGLSHPGGEPETQAGALSMPTDEKKSPRTIDQDFSYASLLQVI
jgi:hypothetical protein